MSMNFPVMMSKTPPKVRWSVRSIGFDNEYVLTHKLGKNKEQIKKLYECGAIGKWADVISRRPPARLGWQDRSYPVQRRG